MEYRSADMAGKSNPSAGSLSSLLQQQIQHLQQAIVSNQAGPKPVERRKVPVQLSQLLQSVTQSVDVNHELMQAPAPSVSQRLDTVTQCMEVNGSSKQVPVQKLIQQQVVTQRAPSYQYKLRIINPSKKSDVKVRLIHNVTSRFESVDTLKQLLMRQFTDLVSSQYY